MEQKKFKQKPYEVDYKDPRFQGMSKNKIKKICKQEYKEKMKYIWRQNEREKIKQKKKKIKDQKTVENCEDKLGWKKYKIQIQEKIDKAPKIFIDAQFEDQQDLKSITSLVNQFCYCHSMQKKTDSPLDLQIYGCGEITKQLLEKRDYDKWLIKFHDQKIDFSLPNLIYLSGDADEEMEEYDPTKIYIIGGLVDHNSLKNITQAKADDLKIKSQKLPLQKYVKLKRSPIITVQECFQILLNLHNKMSWTEAILQALPKRKAIAPNQFLNLLRYFQLQIMDKRVTFVGVDIGTHSIKIAFSRENSKRAEIFEDKVNERIVKNVFSLGGARKIGNLATGEIKSNLSQTVFGVNDFLSNLHHLSGFKESLYHNFSKLYFDNGKVVFQLQYKNKQINLTVEEILAGIFSEIRVQLEQLFPNIQLILVVPDNYSDSQKSQLIKSVMIAGFDNVSIEQNSKALAIQYLLTKRDEISPQTKKNIIFVDIGYSTTKITFLNLEGRNVQVQYFDSKQNLGIRNLDNKIAQYIVTDVWKKTGIYIEGKKKIIQRILEEVRKKRKELSSNRSCNIELMDLLENKNYSFKLQRVWFEQVNRETMQSLERFLVHSLCQAQKNKFNLNNSYEVQVIGGGSRIPMFQDMIMDIFQRAHQKNFDAIETLCLGTAIARNVQVYVSQQIPYDYFLVTVDPWTKQQNKEILFESGTQFQCYKKLNVDPNQNLQFECLLKGPHFQEKVMSFRIDAKEEISIDFEIDEDGFIQLSDDSKEFVYDYWDVNQIEDLKEMRQKEQKILNDHLNDEHLEGMRYELERKLYELKSFKKPQISDQDAQEIKALEEEIKNCMDQNNNEDFAEIQENLHQFMEQIDYMMSRIGGRQNKVQKLKEFMQEYDNQSKAYLTEFDSRYSEQLLKLSEEQSFSIMRKKLQALSIHKKLRNLSIQWNENSALLDEIDIEKEMNQLVEIIDYLKEVVNDLVSNKKIQESVFK